MAMQSIQFLTLTWNPKQNVSKYLKLLNSQMCLLTKHKYYKKII